jgi:hypothetical protein
VLRRAEGGEELPDIGPAGETAGRLLRRAQPATRGPSRFRKPTDDTPQVGGMRRAMAFQTKGLRKRGDISARSPAQMICLWTTAVTFPRSRRRAQRSAPRDRWNQDLAEGELWWSPTIRAAIVRRYAVARCPGCRQRRARQERAEQEKADFERLSRDEARRRADEQADRDRLQREKLEQERASREAAQRLAELEAARLRQQRAEHDRLASEETNQKAQKQNEQRVNTEASIVLISPPDDASKNKSSFPPISGGALVVAIKRELRRIGCYTGSLDDNWNTTDTRASVQRFMKYANLQPRLDEPTESFLNALRTKLDRVCPPGCGDHPAGKDGNCVADTRAQRPNKPAAASSRPNHITPAPKVHGKCFSFEGRQFCE